MNTLLRTSPCGLKAGVKPFTADAPCLVARLRSSPSSSGRPALSSGNFLVKPSLQAESPAVPSVACRSLDPRGGGKAAGFQFNAAYAAIVGTYAALFLFRNPYIFAALSVLTIIPQNSAITSLNSLVILFYESGLFMNFAEAVYCVRLMTWLSIACTLVSFAIFS
ncbi:hypothetical protein HXX76_001960 [Chlamydomonas incerta]|uniref:Uncharacterized protein n=1 Tax=Chlamydomonas incerta TaxID=51695 RepID=A0A835WA52_CHLIN|nr:hypothetical protein HXX76_001960 [Chlamydomonas incerta]|eukprot:KAG2443609.1 hypothetical protein HXX76_001960 [Chlamydomonas incerta]